MVVMETKSAKSFVSPSYSFVSSDIHLYVNMTEICTEMLLHNFGNVCLAALYDKYFLIWYKSICEMKMFKRQQLICVVNMSVLPAHFSIWGRKVISKGVPNSGCI